MPMTLDLALASTSTPPPPLGHQITKWNPTLHPNYQKHSSLPSQNSILPEYRLLDIVWVAMVL